MHSIWETDFLYPPSQVSQLHYSVLPVLSLYIIRNSISKWISMAKILFLLLRRVRLEDYVAFERQ